MTGHFDENDKESWYFGGLNVDESRDILQNEDVGVFLVRDSTRGGYVLCVREKDGVAQYQIRTILKDSETKFFIRDELSFRDLPSMLAFYKRNLFESTALVRPISRDMVDSVVPRHRVTIKPRFGRIVSEIPQQYRPPQDSRFSVPVLTDRPVSRSEFTPGFARVIKGKHPSAYSTTHLELRVGDVIRITQILKDGTGEGELHGKHGRFPLAHVELIKPSEENN